MTYQVPGGMPPPYQPYQPAPKRKRHIVRNVVLAIGGVIVLIIVLSVALGGGGTKPPAAATPAVSIPPSGLGYTATPTPAAATTAPAPPQYTAAQQQAIDAAEGYLSDGEGFSKADLIQQLHSQYGDGFSASMARFAVAHVQVNWRQQAVIAARGYMSDGEGFSYNGLVQQLDSPYGGQFTVAQAEYAAKAVGLS